MFCSINKWFVHVLLKILTPDPTTFSSFQVFVSKMETKKNNSLLYFPVVDSVSVYFCNSINCPVYY